MSTTILLSALSLFGIAAVALGLAISSWWTIAGGVVALTGAAWLVTEPA